LDWLGWIGLRFSGSYTDSVGVGGMTVPQFYLVIIAAQLMMFLQVMIYQLLAIPVFPKSQH